MTEDQEQADQETNRPLPEWLVQLRERCSAAKLKAEVRYILEDEDPYLRVTYPEGRDGRRIVYSEDRARALEGFDIDGIRFLPNLNAIVDTANGEVEAQVRGRAVWQMQRIPGVEQLSTSSTNDSELSDDEVVLASESDWRLSVERDGIRLELSPISERFQAIQGLSGSRAISLKIAGLSNVTSDETVEAVRTLSDAFFFELDVRYGAVMELMPPRKRVIPTRPRREKTALPAEFPRNKYLAQPIGLYRYGRSANGLPLLSFLAYYQVLEFFFPIFTHDEVTRRVQQTLRNPRFDPSNEVSVLGLIDAIRPAVRFGVPEKEQLRATIRRCLDADIAKQFIAANDQVRDHFCGKKQSVSGLQPLRPENSTVDLRDQIADRIYDIRCRIVHTKSDGGEGGVELLMPSGPEANSLGPDIELVRLVAQEALVAGASPLRL